MRAGCARPRAAAAVVVAATLVASPPALASRTQLTMIEDGAQLLSGGPEARAAALDEIDSLGVDVVKLRVVWRKIAPSGGSERRPAFDATDPSAYPPEGWEALDAAVAGAAARGLKVLLMVGPPAPEWATRRGERRDHRGVFKADPADFGRFMEAIGKRYRGGPGGRPAVRLWSIWNEPNHPQFIQPLSERLRGRMTPSAPHQYRRLYVAAQQALARTGHARDRILFGEILPIGQSRLSATNTLRPIDFLRELFCVDRSFKPYRGGAARARRCSPFPRIVTSGFAYHPYTRPEGPRVPLKHPDDATIGQIGRIERALDLIARTRRVRPRLPIYNTEFGIQTEPPDCAGFGASLTRQAAFMNEAEYISFRHPRLRTYSNYLLIDDRILTHLPPGSNARYGGFQSGLRFGLNAVLCESPSVKLPFGRRKQPGYDAFRTPLYVRRLSGRKVEVFGRARPRGRAPQPIEILRDGRVVAGVTARGYFLRRVRGAARGAWQLRWRLGEETFTSRTARALRDAAPRSL